MHKVGFIGLGNMGGPMAANLVKKGCEVSGFDMSDAALQEAGQNGVSVCSSARDCAVGSDVIITMLPSGEHTLDVYNDILPVAEKQSIFIDCSTIDVASAKQAHELAAKAGMASLDAPVSGGVGGAVAGTLTFMVGGKADVFSKAQPMLEVMGARAVHCGAAGAGQSAKICNNMLLAISMIGTCEAFNLADKLGLDQKALFDVMSTSSGQCWSVNTYCPVPGVGPQSPADNQYQPGFSASLMLKDLMLGRQASNEAGAHTPLGEHATDLYKTFVEAGNAEVDFSGIIEALKK